MTAPPPLVELLGPVAVRHGGAVVSGNALGGRRGRVVIVALALAEQPVAADRLAAMVWSDEPPPTWPVALRGIISAIRHAVSPLGLGGHKLIITTPSGYGLASGIDVDIANDGIATAERLLAEQSYAEALQHLESLSVREGAGLLPGEDLTWLDPYRQSIDEARLRSLEITAEAAGLSGDSFRATAAARQAVALAPMEERSHRALIRALDLAGDRAAAVSAYERCRSILAEQLGVDPSRETAEVYLAALSRQQPQPVGRIPVEQSSFVGRAREVDALSHALGKPGLVTVTGRGGVGKSRLALHVARQAVSFVGGRFWVPLATVSDAELVASSVAIALGCQIGDDPVASIANDLSPLGPALLVLDGCELVADGVAELISGLLQNCPNLHLLVTNRGVLGIPGELAFAVEPMPEPDSLYTNEFHRSDAVRLLVDRVRSGGDALVIDSDSAPLISELCAQCGGLPLALELAAAQLCVMPVGDLLDHLGDVVGEDDRLKSILRRGHSLLDDDEAAVFRRFAVLDGNVGLSLIKQVVTGTDLRPVRVIRLLRELAARGLLTVDSSGPRWLYRQDDDVRRFGRELLDKAGETEATYTQLADAIRGLLPEDPRSPPAPFEGQITEARGSVRSLLSAAATGAADRNAGLEIAFRLHRYWAATNVAEGHFWLDRLLAGDPVSPWTSYATYAAGYLSYWAGITETAVRELESAAQLLTGVDDSYRARALIFLAGLADDVDRGDSAVDYVRQAVTAAAAYAVDLQVSAAMGMACVLAERTDTSATSFAAAAIQLCRTGGSAEQLAAAMPTAAMCAWQVGDLEATRAYVDEAWPMHSGGRRIARVVLLSAAAGLALATGDPDLATAQGRTADEEATELGIEREVPLIRAVLARSLLEQGNLVAAADRAAAAVTAARSLSFDFPLALCLETAAVVVLAAQNDDPDHEIPLLLGVSADLRVRGSRPCPPTLAPAVRAAAANVGTRGHGPLDRARLDDAADRALTLLQGPTTG